MEEDTGKSTARRRRHRPYPRRLALPARLQPRRHPAHRDRHQADRGRGRARPRGRQGVRRRAARAHQGARRLRGPHGDGPDALRREPVAAPARPREVRHPLARRRTSTRCAPSSAPPASRSSGTPRCSTSGGTIVQETRHFHEEDGSTTAGPHQGGGRGLPLLPRARPGAGRPVPRVGRGAARRAARAAAGAPQPAARGVGHLRARHAVDPQRGRGRPDRRHDRRRRGRRRPPASGGWASWPAAPTRPASSLAELPITPAQVARVTALVAAGDLNDKLARQVIEGVLAGEGDPDEVVEKRGLKVVSDEGALGAAVDEAIAGNAGHRRQDPRRQGRRGRRAGRRGHEGHPRPGRRGPRAAS